MTATMPIAPVMMPVMAMPAAGELAAGGRDLLAADDAQDERGDAGDDEEPQQNVSRPTRPVTSAAIALPEVFGWPPARRAPGAPYCGGGGGGGLS